MLNFKLQALTNYITNSNSKLKLGKKQGGSWTHSRCACIFVLMPFQSHHTFHDPAESLFPL